MERIQLVTPTADHEGVVWDYRREMLEAGVSLDGGSGLGKAPSAADWLQQVRLMARKETCPEDKVPDSLFLAIRESDGRMVGVIDLRQFEEHPVLSVWGGHIGYSVRPSEHRKGYGTEMLRQMLLFAREKGLEKVMITCHDGNIASEKIIRKNGGVYEKSVQVEGQGTIKRFWIDFNAGKMLTFTPGQAVIEPKLAREAVPDFPETVVSVFSWQLFDAMLAFLGGEAIGESHSVDGITYVYRVNYRGKTFAFCKACLGAPGCVGLFEEVIAMGAKRIILTGNCGVLDRTIADCGIILPDYALRDEGTSYHYAPAADRIPVNRRYRGEFEKILEELGYPYIEGATWTTDAFFRETPEKIAARKAQGAVCVEMECAAMQAMCDYRGVEFFQYLYAGDNLDHPTWDKRSLSGHTRLDDKQKIGLLGFELAWAITHP